MQLSLNDKEVNNPSVPNIDHVEEVRRSICSMLRAAVDLRDSRLPHLVGIFSRDLPGECADPETIKT
jgi:hypothetical protein